ncbi:hypothetical protein SR914_21185 [Comamonas testosteroni]|nr:hypothetical protein [Comamonas testosteroni]WQG65663.1 hypothetical protein SR914_21185 [Comamonas testosteroni]
MSTVDQALPVLSIGLRAAPSAVTCTWLAWRASGKDRAFAPCPEKQIGEAAAVLRYTPLQEGVDMARYMAEQSDSDFLTDVFKIALGVFIGGLLAALAYGQIQEWQLERALAQSNAAMKREMQKVKDQEEKARRDAEQRRVQQEQQRLADEQAARDRAAQQAVQRQQEYERNARREAAWKRYYQPSALCNADPLTVPCVNAGMVARRNFDAQYRD